MNMYYNVDRTLLLVIGGGANSVTEKEI